MNKQLLVTAGVVLLGVSVGCGQEKLAVLTVGTEVYSNVVVTEVTSTDLYFRHAQGIGSAKLRKLDLKLQKQFHYDAAKAAATETKRAPAGAPQLVAVVAKGSAPRPAA